MTRHAMAFSVPSAPCYSLVGKVGADGTPFEVGASYSTPAVATSGELYFGPNDNRYPDNRGTWTAVVIGGTPTPATYVSKAPPAPSTTVPPVHTVPAVAAPSASLAFTGAGPKLWALGIGGLILALVGLIMYFFGGNLRRVLLWLLGR